MDVNWPYCDAELEINHDERMKFGLGTEESYFESLEKRRLTN